jgi:hypothetical protein
MSQTCLCRADYALGKAIRDGQDNGTITKRGIHKTADCSLSPKDIASNAELFGDARDGQGNGIYALADNASPDEFEEELTEAKVEGNLSRFWLVFCFAIAQFGCDRCNGAVLVENKTKNLRRENFDLGARSPSGGRKLEDAPPPAVVLEGEASDIPVSRVTCWPV